jgi:hypothetical protein
VKVEKVSFKRLNLTFLAAVIALLFAFALFPFFSHRQAQAQPINSTISSPQAQTTAITTQIRSPYMDAYITQKGTLTINGIVWEEGKEPPYLTDDPFPLTAEKEDEWNYYLKWTDVISADAYTLQEATQPDFSDQEPIPLDDPKATYQLIEKGTDEDGTYYYRVRANHPDLEKSRWSNVISATVPWSADATSTSTSLSTDVAAASPMTVQVRINDGSWINVDNIISQSWGAEWSYEWDLPEERNTQYTIESRATTDGSNYGPADKITVTLDNKEYTVFFPLIFKRWPPIPYPPALLVENKDDDRDDTYTLSWTYSDNNPEVQDPDSYTLQEATKEDFSDAEPIYSGSAKSYEVTNQEDGTYYYRVRGHNEAGAGEWSNVETVTVQSIEYYYDFSQSLIKPAWPIKRTTYWRGGERGVAWTEEQDGSLFIVMDSAFDFAIGSPWKELPSPPYVIETKARLHDATYLRAYGIIFGGNGGSPCPAYRDTGCLEHYYRLEVSADAGGLKGSFKRVDYHEPESDEDRGKGRGPALVPYKSVPGDPNAWNEWKFVVKSDGIDIYVNGKLWGATDDNKYVNEPYFGVYTSNDEFKPAIGRFDYFYVYPQ